MKIKTEGNTSKAGSLSNIETSQSRISFVPTVPITQKKIFKATHANELGSKYLVFAKVGKHLRYKSTDEQTNSEPKSTLIAGNLQPANSETCINLQPVSHITRTEGFFHQSHIYLSKTPIKSASELREILFNGADGLVSHTPVDSMIECQDDQQVSGSLTSGSSTTLNSCANRATEKTMSKSLRIATPLKDSTSFYDPFPTPGSTISANQTCLSKRSNILKPLNCDYGEEHRDDEGDNDSDSKESPFLHQKFEKGLDQHERQGGVLHHRRKCSTTSTATAATFDCFDSDYEGMDATPVAGGLRDPFPGPQYSDGRSGVTHRTFFPSPHQRNRVSSAVRSTIQKTSNRLRRLRRRSRDLRQKLQLKHAQSIPWFIRSDHPLKVIWDVCTVLLSILSAYLTHTSIRERDYDQSGFLIRFCEIWFFIDILLNFVTQNRNFIYDSNGQRHVSLDTPHHVWARYLTTWFIVDVISFLPWEKIWVKPIVEMQKRRNWFQKTGRRSKVLVKVTRALRGRHIKWFNSVSRQTKHLGYSGKHLLHLIIKYIPKYFVFCKNMKAILAVRFLRQIHWVRKVLKNLLWNQEPPMQLVPAERDRRILEDDFDEFINMSLDQRILEYDADYDDDDESEDVASIFSEACSFDTSASMFTSPSTRMPTLREASWRSRPRLWSVEDEGDYDPIGY